MDVGGVYYECRCMWVMWQWLYVVVAWFLNIMFFVVNADDTSAWRTAHHRRQLVFTRDDVVFLSPLNFLRSSDVNDNFMNRVVRLLTVQW